MDTQIVDNLEEGAEYIQDDDMLEEEEKAWDSLDSVDKLVGCTWLVCTSDLELDSLEKSVDCMMGLGPDLLDKLDSDTLVEDK